MFLEQKIFNENTENELGTKVKFWFQCGWKLVMFVFVGTKCLCKVLLRTKLSGSNNSTGKTFQWNGRTEILLYAVIK